ncbi:MAG: GmrSD restriction endonuclease domain-containing protein, partial [Candidatus Saccharimonadales bacterium]
DLKAIADESFINLEKGLYKLVNENTFKHFADDILRSSGYDEPSMLMARNAVNYAYAMYLRLKEIGENPTDINHNIRRLLAISHLTSRHSGSFETTFESDIKRIQKIGDMQTFIDTLETQELSEVFWESTLPDQFDKVNVSNPFWHIFVAAQKKLLKDSFLTTENKVKDMTTGDIHHIFPKNYLVKKGYDKSQYNKIANFVYLRNDINIAVSDEAPCDYLGQIASGNGKKYHSNLTSRAELINNLKENAIPAMTLDATSTQFEDFMRKRQTLMAKMIHDYYKGL